jgi:hypothetical protein
MRGTFFVEGQYTHEQCIASEAVILSDEVPPQVMKRTSDDYPSLVLESLSHLLLTQQRESSWPVMF